MLTDLVGKCRELYCEIMCEIILLMSLKSYNSNILGILNILKEGFEITLDGYCEIMCEISLF